MLHEDHMFEDTLLPESETIADLTDDPTDTPITEPHAFRGIFSESPENASRWIEQVTRRYTNIH